MQESGEMYLETILMLGKENATIRSVDVAQAMNYSKASVSRAISRLKADEYITVNDNGQIKLTKKGKNQAEKTYERHQILTKFLTDLGVSKETASADACRIEHYISDETFTAIKKAGLKNDPTN